MSDDAPASSASRYPHLFRTYVRQSVVLSLARVREADTPLGAAEREQAIHGLSYALKLPDTWPVTRNLLLTLAPKMEQAGHREDWSPFLERGVEMSENLGDGAAEAELRFHLGVLYQLQARYEDARRQLEASAAHAETRGQSLQLARALNRLAFVARQTREWERAARLAEKALSLAPDASEEAAYAHFVRGAVAFDQRAWQDAERSFHRSLDLREAIGDQRMIAWSRVNLAAALRAQERYDEAIACLQGAIRLFKVAQDPVHEAAAKMNLGNILLSLERWEDALRQYDAAEPAFDQTHDWPRLASLHNNRGIVYRTLEQWEAARHSYQASLHTWHRLGNVVEWANAMDGLGLVHLAQGLYEEAIQTFRAALEALAQIEGDRFRDALDRALREHLREAEARARGDLDS